MTTQGMENQPKKNLQETSVTKQKNKGGTIKILAAAAAGSLISIAATSGIMWHTNQQTKPQEKTTEGWETPSQTLKPLEILEENNIPESPATETQIQNEPPPILAIPNPPGLPRGFGIHTENPPENPKPQKPLPTPPEEPENQETKTGAIPLEKPKEMENTEEKLVESIDPRKVGVTTNEGPQNQFEETTLNIQRTLTAVMGENKQMIRLKIPVMYKSRTLSIDKKNEEKARSIQKELHEKAKTLATLKKDLERLLAEWNKIVEESTPNQILFPESPSLPQNQSQGKINRNQNPDMEPGKAISYEILSN